MTQQWTRDDLPSLSDIAPIAASTESYVYFAAGVVLDAVVAHLNAHHPKPSPVVNPTTDQPADWTVQAGHVQWETP